MDIPIVERRWYNVDYRTLLSEPIRSCWEVGRCTSDGETRKSMSKKPIARFTDAGPLFISTEQIIAVSPV